MKYLTSKNVLIAVLAIGVVILLVTLFRGKGNDVNQDLVKQIIAAKDSVIAVHEDNAALHERLLEEKDKTFEVLQQRDSVLNSHYNETEKLYKQINDKVKAIPIRINRIATNNDSLRIILADY